MKVRLLTMLALLVAVSPVYPAFIIDVDLDRTTPGIQTALSVTPGQSLSVDVLITDTNPGFPGFADTYLLDVLFNDAGNVLSNPAATPVRAGNLAAVVPGAILCYWCASPTSPGNPLLGGSTTQPTGSFANSLTNGSVGLFDSSGTIIPPANIPIDIFSFTLTALSPGTSTVMAAGASPGAGVLAGGIPQSWPPAGTALPTTFNPSTVTVVPLPAAVWLFGSGLFGLIGIARKRNTA